MAEALHFFNTYEAVIYVVLGVGFVLYLKRFINAWNEMRKAIFGLERESAQARLNQSAVLMAVLLLAALAEFTLVTYLSPVIPIAITPPTPTMELLAVEELATVTPETAAEIGITATPLPTIAVDTSGCIADKLAFTSPKNGDQVRGKVEIIGTVNIPNFGFYKYEMAQAGEALWLTLGAGRETRQEALLGSWDTSNLPPGEYYLRLVATDTAGETLPPCMISIYVNPP